MRYPKCIKNEDIENATLLNNGNYIVFSMGFILKKAILCHIAFPLSIVALFISIPLMIRNWNFSDKSGKKMLIDSITTMLMSLALIGMYLFYFLATD